MGTTRAAAASFASSGKLSLYTEFDVNEARTEVISFPLKRVHLLTFSDKRIGRSRVSQLERDRKPVQTFFHIRLKWLKQTGNTLIRVKLFLILSPGIIQVWWKGMEFHPHRNLVVLVMPPVQDSLRSGWVDDVFVAAARSCRVDPGPSLVYSHLPGRRHGRLPRSHGIFQRLKCSTMSVFIQYLDSLDWHSKGWGLA